ncbi:MAG: bifunctional aspartate kinase/homoserine dehydrogenase I [Muribaculaceae bacterium]|nr:bifunctional aspartate kinase/homoserine dehydrogenase I [Muribaculaceae bacterium]
MKVLKFGGSSVGTPAGILNIKNIVESESEPLIVVVSALGGITDLLLSTALQAAGGDDSYHNSVRTLVERHHSLIDAVITDGTDTLRKQADTLLDELKSIYHGLYLIRDLSDKTRALIMSYGERLSSLIVGRLLSGSVLHDARRFIKTDSRSHRGMLAPAETYALVEQEFGREVKGIHVVPGFIATDLHTGEVTNLGRGGSDYTASIIAAALDANVLEIWTDVDGFMTADPRVIPTAYTIKKLSYVEAMELCNFGAKVVYPPTIYPACVKNIPIKVKNTFSPEKAGTVICDNPGEADRSKPIKGISSISGSALITVTGLSMVGVIGVNRRIFSALAEKGISVFMVSQASSENSTSVGVRDEDAERAAEVLNEEFAKEIGTGAMNPMNVEKGLATVAIVGENMKHTPGIAGKLFGALGRSGISVIACAQGAKETNISFVVTGSQLRKALNTLHDSFFLSEYKELNLFICGVGTVGAMLIEQIASQKEELMRTHRLKLNVVGIASSRKALFSRDGIDLSAYRSLLDAAPASNTESLKRNVLGMNIFNSVFVDCTASREVADLYEDFLNHNISVVAANKVAASNTYSSYLRLKETALRRGVKFLYETNVGAGLPIIGTINDLRSSGDRILKIEAVLSGTLNFIFNTLSEEIPFSETVRLAKEAGYSEPDPRIDLSGMDVIRKLVILTREGGYAAEQQEVERNLFVPAELLEGDIEDFWRRLPSLDADFEARRKVLEKEGKRWRFVARMEQGRMSVGLMAVDRSHPFYGLEGSNNIVLLTTERYREYPMLIQGYGAGAGVTAAGVFANIISTANT